MAKKPRASVFHLRFNPEEFARLCAKVSKGKRSAYVKACALDGLPSVSTNEWCLIKETLIDPTKVAAIRWPWADPRFAGHRHLETGFLEIWFLGGLSAAGASTPHLCIDEVAYADYQRLVDAVHNAGSS